VESVSDQVLLRRGRRSVQPAAIDRFVYAATPYEHSRNGYLHHWITLPRHIGDDQRWRVRRVLLPPPADMRHSERDLQHIRS